jgi:hypothetical protein
MAVGRVLLSNFFGMVFNDNNWNFAHLVVCRCTAVLLLELFIKNVICQSGHGIVSGSECAEFILLNTYSGTTGPERDSRCHTRLLSPDFQGFKQTLAIGYSGLRTTHSKFLSPFISLDPCAQIKIFRTKTAKQRHRALSKI